jgi:predicted dithiol-disulfide oxidoreductase (DUF899 family)
LDEALALVESNYRDRPTDEQAGMPWFTSGELDGMSVFLRDGDSIYHTYSIYARGTDQLNGTYN